MTDWTPDLVEERLAEAAFVLKRLPEPRRQGYFSTWPATVYSFADKVGQEPKPMRVLPSPMYVWSTPEPKLRKCRSAENCGEPGRMVWRRF